MTVNLYTFVDLYRRALDTAAHLLAQGAAHGVAEAEMLDWRLAPDMHPLSFQLTVVINFARQWPARVIGAEAPGIVPAPGVAGLQAAIAEARAYLDTLTAEQFAGRDDAPITYCIGEGMEPTLPAGQWLTVFATTNLYFHLSTAYGILRAHGVPIGKRDLFAGGL